MTPFLPARLRSALPAISLLAIATLLTGCNQIQPQSASVDLPDLHTPTYVGAQLDSMPQVSSHHRLRPSLDTVSGTISRHARHR